MILRRYIIRSLGGPFLIGFGLVTFVLMMNMFLDLLDLLIGKGIDIWSVTRLFLFALGWMVALSIPCGVLVAALMAYGRLSQDNEIIALRASGVHLGLIILPALALSVIVAAGLTLFNNYVLPESNFAYASLIQEITRKRPTAQIREGVIISDFKGYDLWIGRLNDRTGDMQDVLILDSRTRTDSPRTILGRTGTLTFRPDENALNLVLHDGEIHEADPASPTGEYRRLSFETQTMSILQGEERWRSHANRTRGQREMSVRMMQDEIGRLRREYVRQDSLLLAALESIPLESLAELDRLDPGSMPRKPGLGSLLAGVADLLGGAQGKIPDPPPEWTSFQRRAIELVRSRQREQMLTMRKIHEFQVEIHKKYSIPVACIVFVLVGAPLGIMARRGGLTAGVLSAGFFVFYYLCLIGGESLADRMIIAPWAGMWTPNIILGGLGMYLSARAVVSGHPARPQKKAAA